jgi:hypothetical protein
MQADGNDRMSVLQEAILKLESLAQEFQAIRQELSHSQDSQRGRVLLAWAFVCIDEYHEVVRHYLDRSQKERSDRSHNAPDLI